jgi:uncharacterized membrane protein YhiD involved in acid resistance
LKCTDIENRAFELQSFTDRSDVSRAIQGVITGIGFLGAGVILQNRATGRISGLTTAASIWVTANNDHANARPCAAQVHVRTPHGKPL